MRIFRFLVLAAALATIPAAGFALEPAPGPEPESCATQREQWYQCGSDCEGASNTCFRTGHDADTCNAQYDSCINDCDGGMSWWCGFWGN